MSEIENNPFMGLSSINLNNGIDLENVKGTVVIDNNEDELTNEKLLDSLRGKIPEGLLRLIEGYIDYAKEVVVSRALPNIDGLNPVQRRILYTFREIEKIKDLTKCQLLAGKVLALHPHGDVSVYKTMVRLTHLNESCNIPYLIGKGSFGKVYSKDKPSAARYTECMLSDIVDEFFMDMDGITMLPSYNNELLEPELLPVSYPNILCNPTIGIAVGIASNIPPFNFNEVNKATIELIETGDIAEPLVPDFTTGGSYVRNDAELNKLMTTGKAKLRVRGSWHIEGKEIIITEIPYYTTVQNIKDVVSDMKYVTKCNDSSDRNGFECVITTSSKKRVDEVLTQVLRDTKIQMNLGTNVVVIIDNKPKVLGVKDLLKEWVKFREKTLKLSMEKRLSELEPAILKNEVLLDILKDDVKRTTLINIISTDASEDDVEAYNYLGSLYPTVGKEIFDYILDLNLKGLNKSRIGKREKALLKLKLERFGLEENLKDIKSLIVNQLKGLNKKFVTPRKTKITDVDYVFEKENKVAKSEPVPVRFVIEDKFIKRLKDTEATANMGIPCMSNDIISLIDTQGRLLRVNMDNLQESKPTDRGTYLSVYLETEDDFEIVSYNKVEAITKGYIYSDGFASVLDYSEWVGLQRCTRMTVKGVNPLAYLIMAEVDFSTSHIFALTNKGRFCFADLDFKRKNRTARTKLIEGLMGGEVLSIVIPLNVDIMSELVTNYESYIGKVSELREGDVFNNDLYQDLISKKG